MRSKRITLLLTTIALLFVAQLPAAGTKKAGEIVSANRSFKAKNGEVVEYEVGTFYVRENRDEADSRVISIGFARFPCTAKTAKGPPLFRLPGGPGSSFLEWVKPQHVSRMGRSFPELASLRSHCDVVLVDQRGYSTRGEVLRATRRRPTREKDQLVTPEDDVADYKAFAAEAVAQFASTKTDLRGYTVKECAHDVNELRKALGYDKIMLQGTSFGSQWSFAIMRLHPDIVERALLSGVEPLNHSYDMPSYVFAAVQRMWRTIDDDKRFAPYLPEGGMAEAAHVVIERLEREPVKLQVAGKAGEGKQTIGFITPQDFPWNEPTEIIELYHHRYDRWRTAAALRLLAQRTSGRTKLIGPLIDSSLGVTPERRHRLWTDPAVRYLGRRNFASYLATADIWPSPDVGDDFRTPVRSDISVVFAQGTWDTQTPLENTFEIAPFFPNSRVIIAERGGHGVIDNIARERPQTWKQIEEFLKTGDTNDIPVRIRLSPSRKFHTPKWPVNLE